jgi:hypothetical protein
MREAFASLDESIVDQSILKELQNMEDMGVWEFINNPQDSRSKRVPIVPSKLFLKPKHDAQGKFIKLKARLVAGGHRQKSDSYGNTTAPTVDTASVMLILSLVQSLGGTLATLDIPAAYLNAPLKEEIDMILPKDLSAFMCAKDRRFRSMVDAKGYIRVKLLKSLYGLKQSAANWYEFLANLLLELGFRRLSTDACVFVIGSVAHGNVGIVAIHVDDMLLVFQRRMDYEKLMEKFTSIFGPLEPQMDDISFLGMNIRIDDEGFVKVNQPGFCRKICEAFGIRTTAATPSTADFFTSQDVDPDPAQSSNFKSKLMSMMFAAIRTRPDILKECIFLSSFALSPGKTSFQKLTRVYQYVYGTLDRGIRLGGELAQLIVHSDASFAIHLNGKSHSGIVITLAPFGGPIIAKSKMQSLITLSSTEAELVAAIDGVRRAEYLQRTLIELTFPMLPIVLRQDNKSTIAIIKNGEGYKGKSRHMRVMYGYLNDLFRSQALILEYEPTNLMVADILTKPMGGEQFRFLRYLLMGRADEDEN